jgi:hypothetical protein
LPLFKGQLYDHETSGHIEGTPEIHRISRGTVTLGMGVGGRRGKIRRTCPHLYTKNNGIGAVPLEDIVLIVTPEERE